MAVTHITEWEVEGPTFDENGDIEGTAIIASGASTGDIPGKVLQTLEPLYPSPTYQIQIRVRPFHDNSPQAAKNN